jgi:hypothetical protein
MIRPYLVPALVQLVLTSRLTGGSDGFVLGSVSGSIGFEMLTGGSDHFLLGSGSGSIGFDMLTGGSDEIRTWFRLWFNRFDRLHCCGFEVGSWLLE